jgi:hypothetical protein
LLVAARKDIIFAFSDIAGAGMVDADGKICRRQGLDLEKKTEVLVCFHGRS